MMRTSGRNSVRPPGCEACAIRTNCPGIIMPDITIAVPFPPRRRNPPRPAGYIPQKVPLPPFTHPAPAWVCLLEACLKVRAETFELPKTDSLPNFPHDVKVKVEVVVSVQDDRKEFSGGIEVPQVCTGIPPADGAPA